MVIYSTVQTSIWGCDDFMRSIIKTDNTKRPKCPLSLVQGYAACSINIDTWKTLLTGDEAVSITRETVGDDRMFEVYDWRMELSPNRVCAAYSRQTKSHEPIAFAVMLDSSVDFEEDDKYSQKTNKAFKELHEFQSVLAWSNLRASLKCMHALSERDCIRGNYRFNFGFAELACDKAAGFTGIPIDPSDGMFYPRIARAQYAGGEPCSIALDYLIRLVGRCRFVLTSDAIPGFSGLQISYPLRFPLVVKGYNTMNPLSLGLKYYVSGCEVMNRMSVCMFEGPTASTESTLKMDTLFGLSGRQRRFGDKFLKFWNSRMHRDKRNTSNSQMFIVVSFKIPYECMCMMNLDTNEHIVFCDPNNKSDGIKIYIFVGQFRDVYHGRIELDASWTEKCSNDAWMLRITPYTTSHAKKWNDKMNHRGEAYTHDLLQSLYGMDDSEPLGCTPDKIASLLREKADLDFPLPPPY